MLDFFVGQLWFLITIVLVLWIPGRAAVLVLERKEWTFTFSERIAVSTVFSIAIADFVMIVLGRCGISLTGVSVGSGIIVATLGLWGGASFLQKSKERTNRPFVKEKKSFVFVLVLCAALFVKMAYLVPNIVPTSTDLGHHTFWVEKIVETKSLPVYQERDIETNSDGRYEIGEEKSISDFIEGEHLSLAAITMISEKNVVSGFAILVLFFVHVATLFSVYALGKRLFEKYAWGETIGILTLFLYGVLYAIGGSQLRYVTGGAVGNVLGNLFIPVTFLLLVVAVRNVRADLLIAGIVALFTMVYTHHLSTLVFGVALIGVTGMFCVVCFKRVSKNIFPLLKRVSVWTVIAGCVGFFLCVYSPAYIRNHAASQVVGTPENEEHLGFSLAQLSGTVGDPRLSLGIAGIALLFLWKKTRKTDVVAILTGWTVPLAVLVLYPDMVRINLPSARVANYLVLPLSILSGFALFWIFCAFARYGQVSRKVFLSVLVFGVVTIAYRGFSDNDLFFKMRPMQTERARELFHAATYAADTIPRDVVVMHDHINIPGDSWIKVFFMRDYNYPLYRALLFRYDRATDKQEKCTLYVLSKPDSTEAKKCQDDLNVRALLVDEKLDGQQFQHFREYDKVYSDAFQSVYVRNK